MGVLATPLIHDVEHNSDGITSRQSSESRALRSVLRNHAEGYALLCFHFVCRHVKFNTPLVELAYQAVETAKCLLEGLATKGIEEVGVASVVVLMCSVYH